MSGLLYECQGCCADRCNQALEACRADIASANGAVKFAEFDWNRQSHHTQQGELGQALFGDGGWADSSNRLVVLAADCVWANALINMFMVALEAVRELCVAHRPDIKV